MVVSEAILGAIAALALQAGINKIEQTRQKDGSIIITGVDGNGNKVTLVKFSNPTLGSPQYDITLLTTSQTKKDDKTPIYKITNDSSIDKRIFTIAFIPVDATTKTDAVLEIFLNEKRLFPISDAKAGMLSGVTSLNVPIPDNFGLAINESKSLEVFLWNGVAAAPVNITFAIFIANMR